MSAIGVDKIGLLASISELTIDPDFKPKLTGDIDPATGEAIPSNLLYTNAAGRSIYGTKAFVNTPHYQATIGPGRDGKPLFGVQFSGCAVASSNIEPLDRESLLEAMKVVARDLAERGCRVDLNRLSLYRLDATRNNELEEPVAGYFPLLAACGLRKTTHKRDFGGTGFLCGPKTKIWQVAAYDKQQELADKGHDVTLCAPNTLRVEARGLKSGAVRRMFDVRTVPGILENWANIRAGFVKAVTDNVVKFEPEKTKAEAPSPKTLERAAESEMRQFQARLGSNWWRLSGSIFRDQYWVSRYGLEAASAAIGRVMGTETKVARQHVRRIQTQLEAVSFGEVLEDIAPSGRTNAALYQEIKTKLLAA